MRDDLNLTDKQAFVLHLAGRTIAEDPDTEHDAKWALLLTALRVLEDALGMQPHLRVPEQEEERTANGIRKAQARRGLYVGQEWRTITEGDPQ
jgi:hypothetical protein